MRARLPLRASMGFSNTWILQDDMIKPSLRATGGLSADAPGAATLRADIPPAVRSWAMA